MPQVALTILKYLFLALIFLFLARAVRAMYLEISGPRTPRAPSAPPAATGRAGKPPDKVALLVGGEKPRIFDLRDELILGRSGKCHIVLGDTYADDFNRNATANATFNWHDLNSDKLYQPGEVNLDLNGADFKSISAASNRVLNPKLKEPNTWETTTSFEREMAANMGIRVMYVYKLAADSIASVNTLRPYSAWNVPITRRDPGPDGNLGTADDAGTVTLYDYSAAYKGAAFVNSQNVNADNTDHFHSIEFTLTKRSSSPAQA